MRHLTFDDYETRPWKNGKGDTQDIYLHPRGSDHSKFEIRFSTAPIIEDGPFSSFPNADRCITLIEGEGLVLDFGEAEHKLLPRAPYHFNSVLSPDGKLIDGPVRVVNVMANFDSWKIITCRVVDDVDVDILDKQFAFFFAIEGNWMATQNDGVETLAMKEALLIEETGGLVIKPRTVSQGIFAILERV